MRHDPATLLLYRLVDQQELDLIADSGWLAFPACLPEQHVFYPMLNADYAAQLAHYWNESDCGAGYLVRFALDADYAGQFPVQTVGDQHHEELWVPANELADFNQHIFGQIEVIGLFKS